MTLPKTLHVAFIVAVLALAGHAFAKSPDGALVGQVVNHQGESLPGTELQISNANGRFRFWELEPGQYSVTASLEGFSTVTYENIRKGDST